MRELDEQPAPRPLTGAPAADVFLSYSRADTDAVLRLRATLKSAGLATFLDRDQLPAGQSWLTALERGIAGCAAVAVLVGPAGLGTWQRREVQLALDRQAELERQGRSFPVIPVILPGVGDPPGGFLKLMTWVDLRADPDDPGQFDLLLKGIRGQPVAGAGLRAALCPYRGLLAFREEDAGLFFGREAEVDNLVEKVRHEPLLTLIGRSGSGKSSVIQAGLIPALRRRADGRSWAVVTLRPGDAPLHALVRSFDPPPPDLSPLEATARTERQVELFRADPALLGAHVRGLLAAPAERGTDRLLLYVDQWEELYTQAQRPGLDAERAEADVSRFIDLLLHAASTSACTVVATARADFYADLLRHGLLAAALPPGLVNLGPMARADLTRAIVEPAAAVGLAVDAPLRDTLLDAVSHDSGKLPLLEYALKETWQRSRKREPRDARLSLDDYGAAGGIEGAIARRADDLYAGLDEVGRAAARRLFVSLVTPGEGREDTRARVALPDEPAMAAVVHTFSGAEARLLVTGDHALPDRPGASRLVEISHEALIREWQPLKEWVEANRETLRQRERVRDWMAAWTEHGRDRSLLLPEGLALEEGRQLLDDHGEVLIDEVRPYIEESLAADAEAKAAEAAKAHAEQERELVAAQERALSAQRLATEQRKRTRLAFALSLFALVFAGLAGWQWWDARRQEQLALKEQARATAQARIADEESRRAAEQALAAEEQRALAQKERDRAQTEQQKALIARNEALANESRFLARISSAALDKEGPVTAALLALRGLPAKFDPPDRPLVIDTTSALKAALTAQSERRVLAHDGPVSSAVFSPDGARVLTASVDNAARLWDTVSGQELSILRGHENLVYSAVFSPDGARVLTASLDRTARLWSTVSGQELRVLRAHQGPVFSAVFSPDGVSVLTASLDRTVRLWDTASGQEVRVLRGHEDWVSSAVFSPNGARVLTASLDRTARLWDTASGQEVRVLRGHEDWVNSAVFSPDGARVLTASSDNTARLWDTASGRELRVLRGHEKSVTSAVFSPDGARVLTFSADNTAGLWDTASGRELRVLRGHESLVFSAVFSPDGSRGLTASLDRTARLWDMASGQELRDLRGHEYWSDLDGFSPDDAPVLTASDIARLWDAWPTAQLFVAEARRRMPRQLTAAQEEHFGLRRAEESQP